MSAAEDQESERDFARACGVFNAAIDYCSHTGLRPTPVLSALLDVFSSAIGHSFAGTPEELVGELDRLFIIVRSEAEHHRSGICMADGKVKH
ncbi:MAG: hypothetical protein ABL982_00125 [Vicinamibacterales bacterium]